MLGNMSNEDLNKYAFLAYCKRQKLSVIEKNLMMQLLTRDFRKRRSEQQLRLKEWEDSINMTTNGNPPVKVENNVDLEEPPIGFTYVIQCKVKRNGVFQFITHLKLVFYLKDQKLSLFALFVYYSGWGRCCYS